MLPNSQFPADLVTFTEESLNGKLHFVCSAMVMFVIFRAFLMFEQIFLSPIVKQSLIVSNKLVYTSFS